MNNVHEIWCLLLQGVSLVSFSMEHSLIQGKLPIQVSHNDVNYQLHQRKTFRVKVGSHVLYCVEPPVNFSHLQLPIPQFSSSPHCSSMCGFTMKLKKIHIFIFQRPFSHKLNVSLITTSSNEPMRKLSRKLRKMEILVLFKSYNTK